MTRARRAFSLPEVLVASLVLALLLLPVMFMFLSAAGGAGADEREMRATVLAQELLEQVIAAQRNTPMLLALPLANDPPGAKEAELDFEEALARRPANQLGIPLVLPGSGALCTRMYVSPTRSGFHRYLAISPSGREASSRPPWRDLKPDAFLSAPALFRATVRVHYVTPMTTQEVGRDVRLSTLLYMDPTPVHPELVD